MQVSTVSAVYERQLRRLAEDPRIASSVSLESEPAPESFVSSPALPLGIVFRQPTPAEEIDFETLKIVAQEQILPFIGAIWPQSEPFVTGVQAIWATKEFWDAISDANIDTTKRSITGVRAAQKVVSALLSFPGAPTMPTNLKLIGGLVMATTDELYALRNTAGAPPRTLPGKAR